MEKQEVEVYVEKPRRYIIAKTFAPFNKGKELIESVENGKFKIPAVWLNQQVRQERGYQDDVSQNGNWVLEGILYRQKANDIFTRIGLPYLHPDDTVSSHLKQREYTLKGCTQDEIDKAIVEGLEISLKDLDENGNLIIPCTDFGSNKYSLFFFGGKGDGKERSDRAKESGLWLINSPEQIDNFVVYLNKKNYSQNIGKDYANQLWFRGLVGWSGLDCLRYWYWDLRYDSRVLGVSDSAESAAQNSAKK